MKQLLLLIVVMAFMACNTGTNVPVTAEPVKIVITIRSELGTALCLNQISGNGTVIQYPFVPSHQERTLLCNQGKMIAKTFPLDTMYQTWFTAENSKVYRAYYMTGVLVVR